MTKVFVDGSAGTTGLRIMERLGARKDLSLITLTEENRKDPAARKEAINQADIVFLCLPDDAAREAVAMTENDHTVIIDTSTAHRTDPRFAYGFPEIGGLREKIRTSKRIANPGCHASGFIALVSPLVEKGRLDKTALLTCFSLTGYSGGGKKMIAEYEDPARDPLLKAPRQYGIAQHHKHLPEMSYITGLTTDPVFCPIVADYYAGMEVTVPLFKSQVKGTLADIEAVYESYYQDGLVHFVKGADEGGYLSGNRYEDRDDMEISVFGNEDRILLVSRFDNLGKGASGAAVQNMNLVLGLDEKTGLVV
ncbi:MAG: N-acetyl-gamma-glutamyl-phosphate reductase [Lachnospiraceae bacterium]|nr:N-acetyl-gamma-glutamyl-phosphate reductase [Lachnospiraceae bacterium]